MRTSGTRKVSLKDDLGDIVKDYLPECKQNEDFIDAGVEFTEMVLQMLSTIEEHLEDVTK